MLNKSIRLTKEDAIGLQVIISHDPRVEKGQSEALYYVFKDAARNIPDWSVVAKTKFNNDSNVNVEPDFANIKTFYIEENDFNTVLESLKQQLHLTKVRISYMTRLCILAARMRFNTEETCEMNTNTPLVKVEKIEVPTESIYEIKLKAIALIVNLQDREHLEKVINSLEEEN